MTPATPRQGKTPGPPPGVLLFPLEKAPRHHPPPAARARHPLAGPSPVAALLRPLSGACPPLRGPPARKEIPAAPAAGMVCVHEITSLCKRRANPRKAPPRPPPSYNPVNLPPRHLPQTRPTSHFYIPVAMSTDFYIPVRFSPNPPDFRPQPLRVSGQTLPTPGRMGPLGPLGRLGPLGPPPAGFGPNPLGFRVRPSRPRGTEPPSPRGCPIARFGRVCGEACDILRTYVRLLLPLLLRRATPLRQAPSRRRADSPSSCVRAPGVPQASSWRS